MRRKKIQKLREPVLVPNTRKFAHPHVAAWKDESVIVSALETMPALGTLTQLFSGRQNHHCLQ